VKEILVTNDDGYESDGLHALIEALRPLGHVTVVAPASEKSACGHSLTLTRPLRFVSVEDDFYKLEDGTPSDCVYLALHSIFENRKPDLIVSGINRGANMGEDITYSGTVSAAMEGVLYDVPSIAVSQVLTHSQAGNMEYDYHLAATVTASLVQKIFASQFPLEPRKLLNLNIPNLTSKEQFKGIKITKAAHRYYGNDAHRHVNPRGEEYWWLGLHPLEWRDDLECDFNAIMEGYASLTPIMLDLTCHNSLSSLKQWLND